MWTGNNLLMTSVPKCHHYFFIRKKGRGESFFSPYPIPIDLYCGINCMCGELIHTDNRGETVNFKVNITDKTFQSRKDSSLSYLTHAQSPTSLDHLATGSSK